MDDSSIGLDLVFGGVTATNKISLIDNLADALNITEGSNSYLKFVTTNNSEEIVFGKDTIFNGIVTADAGVKVDNITIDGNEIDLSSGDLTIDVDSKIILDADGGDIFLKDGGTQYGSLTNLNDNLVIKSGTTTALTFNDANVTFAGTINSGDITSNGIIKTTDTTGSSSSTSGSLQVAGGVGIVENAYIGGNLFVTGDMTINGTTTTVNSNTVTIDDPIITLGGDTVPGSNDNKDRGIEFRYYDSEARLGFIGYDNSNSKFVILTSATNNSEVFSGVTGTLVANIDGTINTATQNSITTMTGVTSIGSSGVTTTLSRSILANEGLNLNEQNITNVGSVSCDSIIVDDSSNGLDIVFGGSSTTNKISLSDNLSDALNITQGSNSYLKFVTTDDSEQIIFGKNSTFSGTTIADLGSVTTVDINGGTIDGVDITMKSNNTLDVSNGTLTTSSTQNLAIIEGASSNIDIGDYSLTAQTLISDIATGSAPLIVSSTTKVANLHASQVTGSVDVSGDTLTTSSTQNLAIIEGASSNIDIGDYSLTAQTLISDIATGSAPLIVSSTTKVANLHASQVTGSVDVSGDTLTTSSTQNLAIIEGASSNIDIGDYSLRAQTLISDIATGSAPLIVSSTTKVANLHASQVTGSVDVSGDTLTTSSTQNLAIIEGASSNIDIGDYSLTAQTLISDIATGSAPLIVSSTTKVANLHASQVTGSVDVSGDTLTTSSTQNLAIIEGASSNIDIGDYSLTAQTLISDIATGSAPLTVSSTTKVANLHASQVTGSVDVSGDTLTTSSTQNLAIIEGASSNIDIGDYSLRAQTLISDIATGSAPLIVSSTTKVANLHASQVTGSVDVSGDTLITSSTQNLAIIEGASSNIDIGNYSLRAQTLISDIATGSAPLTVSSTTKVANLHASQVTGSVDVSGDTLITSSTQNLAIIEGASSNIDIGNYSLTAQTLTDGSASLNNGVLSGLSRIDGDIEIGDTSSKLGFFGATKSLKTEIDNLDSLALDTSSTPTNDNLRDEIILIHNKLDNLIDALQSLGLI